MSEKGFFIIIKEQYLSSRFDFQGYFIIDFLKHKKLIFTHLHK